MITSEVGPDGLRDCFRDPIPEIFEAATLLDDAASAHLRGDRKAADELLRAADMPIIGEWLDTIWLGSNTYRAIRKVDGLPPVLPKADRASPRDATPAMKKVLVARDGFHCRLCGIPLIRAEVRKAFTKLYPDAARWTGIRADQQHHGLQVMWLQYDHVVVHSRGGETTMENLVVTCPACNFGRDRYMMSEVGLRDPRSHPRLPSWTGSLSWDGLERLLPENDRFHVSLAKDQPSPTGAPTSYEGLRQRVLEDPILASDGNHSARLWRVAEACVEDRMIGDVPASTGEQRNYGDGKQCRHHGTGLPYGIEANVGRR